MAKKSAAARFLDIPISSIKVLKQRTVDTKTVRALAKSIEREGLHYPITVYWRGGIWSRKYVIVAGLHRLLATESIGQKTIRAEVIDSDQADAWHNAENILRNEPSALERARGIADFARCVLPKTASLKGGEQPHNRNISRVARELGFGRRTVRNAFLIDTLTEAIRDRLVESNLDDNESFLVKVSKFKTDHERSIAIDQKKKFKLRRRAAKRHRSEVSRARVPHAQPRGVAARLAAPEARDRL